METVNDTTPPTDLPPYQRPGNRLTRSTDDKVVSGLSGGLGRYFGIDPVVFRIAFVVLTLAGGSGILLYLVGWLMIPDDKGVGALHRVGNERNAKLLASVLAGGGLLLLLDSLSGGHDDIPLSLALVGMGALFLWSRRTPVAGGPPAPPAPPAPPTHPSGPADGAMTTIAMPAVATIDDMPAPAPVDDPPAPATPAATTAAPKPRSALVPVTLSLLAVLAGGLTLVGGVSLTTGIALALLLTGGALIVGAWRGRARWLIPVGLVLSMTLAAASVIDVPVRGGSGDVSFRPAALEEIASPYRLAAGDMTVDLGALDLGGRTVTIVASVAAGHVDIVVPANVAVEIDAHVGAGNLLLLGREADGLDIRRTVDDPGLEGAGRIVLRARAGVGLVEVRRAAP